MRELEERSIDSEGVPQPVGARRGRTVTVNLAESPLGWLRSRALITLAQFEAGERLRADYERAAGPGLADILWRVVCAGVGLPAAEKALQWPARAGRLVLTLALNRLATHYGIG
jgi:hypothetical protein